MTRKEAVAAFSAACVERGAAAEGYFLERSGTGKYRIARRLPHGIEWPAGRRFVSLDDAMRQARSIGT